MPPHPKTSAISFPLALLFLAASYLSAQPVGIFAETARLTTFSDRIEALGTLRANESIIVTSTVTQRVSSLHFDDGEQVEQGQMLVQLSNLEELAALQEARSALEEAKRQLVRVQQLQVSGGAAESLIDERQREVLTLEARVSAVLSRLSDLEIRAPFAGITGFREVSLGALVAPGVPITTLDDLGEMKLDFTIPSTSLGFISIGSKITARTRAFPDLQFEGTVRSINTRIDPVSRSATVRAVLPNPDFILRPGLLMTVQIASQPRESIAVSEGAIIPIGEQTFVYTIDRSGGDQTTVQRREVMLGSRQPGRVEVRSGLEPGEVVVADGTLKVRNGAQVTILSLDQPDLTVSEKLRN
ncbi:MAG: efflux RND transporter periplasmic adaptor subunit [Puniceicoccaceae bacterium]